MPQNPHPQSPFIAIEKSMSSKKSNYLNQLLIVIYYKLIESN